MGVAGARTLIVSGTDTGVGKTVVTAALAALARDAGRSVAVVKPAQTGVRPGRPGDLDDIRRLSGVTDLYEFARYADPLAPGAAARHADLPPPDMAAAASTIRSLRRDLVVVEGAGGLLVRFDEDGTTLADLAYGLAAPVLLVTRSGLGTLNHTALSLEAISHRGLRLAGVVIGSWPARPGLDDLCNVGDLETLAGRPLAGAIPAGIGKLAAPRFTDAVRGAVSPHLGGTFDGTRFRDEHDAELDAYRTLPVTAEDR